MTKATYNITVADSSDYVQQSGTVILIPVADKTIYASYVVTSSQCRLVHIASGRVLYAFGQREYKSPKKYITMVFEGICEESPDMILKAINAAEKINEIPSDYI